MRKKIFELYCWLCEYIDVAFFAALVIFAVLCSFSCSRHTQENIERVEVRYIDSTIFHFDTINIDLPVERVVNIVPVYDTLRLETSLARAIAFVDTNANVLRGEIENTKDKLPVEVRTKERIIYKDSIRTVEKPVRVDVVKYRTPKGAILTIFGLVLSLLGYVGWNLRKPILGILRKILK